MFFFVILKRNSLFVDVYGNIASRRIKPTNTFIHLITSQHAQSSCILILLAIDISICAKKKQKNVSKCKGFGFRVRVYGTQLQNIQRVIFKQLNRPQMYSSYSLALLI